MRDQLISDGYSLDFQHEFAFPVFCWELELDVSLPTALSASERAVLRLAGAGLGTTAEFAHALGFGPDVRLVADAATRLLERSALGIVDGRLAALESGRQMLAADLMLRRERVRQNVYWWPIDAYWAWRRPDRLPKDVGWTVDWRRPVAPPAQVKDAITDLVSKKGVPALDERSVGGSSPARTLHGVVQQAATVTHDLVLIERWIPAAGDEARYLGYRDGQCDPRLSGLLVGAQLAKKRRRLVLV